MKEQLVTFDTAELAKTKGFKFDLSDFDDYEDMALYSGYYQLAILPGHQNYQNKKYTSLPLHWLEFNHGGHECVDNIDQPTLSLLKKWLREEHKLHFHIYYGKERKWGIDIYSIKEDIEEDYCAGLMNNPNQFTGYATYEEALEVGIFEALKLI